MIYPITFRQTYLYKFIGGVIIVLFDRGVFLYTLWIGCLCGEKQNEKNTRRAIFHAPLIFRSALQPSFKRGIYDGELRLVVFSSFSSPQNRSIFEHGAEQYRNEHRSCIDMGKRGIQTTRWMLHHSILPLLKEQGGCIKRPRLLRGM